MISDTTISAVRDVAIEDIVGKHTELKKYKACCPLPNHGEKTPSFNVDPIKNMFKCFGCGEGGDGIKFIQLMLGADFVAAVERIASDFNITIEYTEENDKEEALKQRETKEILRKHLVTAHTYYKKELKASDAVMHYLTDKRGFDEDTIDYWGLGYGGSEWRGLTDIYSKEGYLPQAIELGICKEKENKQSFDFFRERVIFPIQDHYGQLVSFGGRITDNSEQAAKYLNGKDSPLYIKSKVLYGLYQALPSIRKLGYAILVEGYTDVISMHRAGVTNTIATCGTALTDEHMKLLKRFMGAQPIVYIFRDADKAGKKASQRDVLQMLENGIQSYVINAPNNQDPDDFAKTFINQTVTE